MGFESKVCGLQVFVAWLLFFRGLQPSDSNKVHARVLGRCPLRGLGFRFRSTAAAAFMRPVGHVFSKACIGRCSHSLSLCNGIGANEGARPWVVQCHVVAVKCYTHSFTCVVMLCMSREQRFIYARLASFLHT